MLVEEALRHQRSKTPVSWLGKKYLIKNHLHGHRSTPSEVGDWVFTIVPYYRPHLYKPIIVEAEYLEEVRNGK